MPSTRKVPCGDRGIDNNVFSVCDSFVSCVMVRLVSQEEEEEEGEGCISKCTCMTEAQNIEEGRGGVCVCVWAGVGGGGFVEITVSL